MAGEKRFAEVRKMLETAGWKPGRLPLSIPVHRGKVKPYYVRQVEKTCQGD